jgi:hypothetical protein
MNTANFSASERLQLLERYYTLRRNLTAPHKNAFLMAQRQMMSKERDAVMQEYAERLPFVKLSRCPFCAKVLEYPMDTGGLNGPWWFNGPLAEYPKPDGCEHFRVLLGAMHFGLNHPIEAEMIPEVLPGPGVPFVIPRMLEKVPAMKAVISRFTMPPGYECYPIAYFSEKPVHGALLHQAWGRQAYQVLDEEGKYEGWSAANDKLDFELQPWIDKGVLLWINPGDTEFTLQSRPPCPYVNLPGVRAPQKIVRGKLETMPLPTGERFQPFE